MTDTICSGFGRSIVEAEDTTIFIRRKGRSQTASEAAPGGGLASGAASHPEAGQDGD